MTLAGMGAHDFSACGDFETLGGAAMGFQFLFWLLRISRHLQKSSLRSYGFTRLQNPLHVTTCLSGAQQCCAPTKEILCRLRGLLRTWFCCWCALFGGQQCDQNVAFHARHCFDLAVLADFAQQARHLGTAHFLVRHFAAAMKNHGAHFMAFSQEANDLVLANLVIVLRGGRPKLYFLELRATTALALLMRLFV